MDRWTGLLQSPLFLGGPPFRVAASFILSCQKPCPFQAPTRSSSRATASAAPAIEQLSDAGLLAGKLDGEANAWLIDAACFAGPFVVYRELVPSVDAVGDPKRYDPTGFPAAAGVANILTHCVGEQIQNMISRGALKDSADIQHPTASLSSYSPPRTVTLGFSKGGVVVNQLVTELSCWASKSMKNSAAVSQPSPSLSTNNLLVAASTSDVLSSISEFHYVDVGLNCAGAYITDHAVIKEIANYVYTLVRISVLSFMVLRSSGLIQTAHGSGRRKTQCCSCFKTRLKNVKEDCCYLKRSILMVDHAVC